LSIEVDQTRNAMQDRYETFHDMRQPVASVLALAAVALTEPDRPVAARGQLGQTEWLGDLIPGCLATSGQDEPVVKTVVKHGRRMPRARPRRRLRQVRCRVTRGE